MYLQEGNSTPKTHLMLKNQLDWEVKPLQLSKQNADEYALFPSTNSQPNQLGDL